MEQMIGFLITYPDTVRHDMWLSFKGLIFHPLSGLQCFFFVFFYLGLQWSSLRLIILEKKICRSPLKKLHI